MDQTNTMKTLALIQILKRFDTPTPTRKREYFLQRIEKELNKRAEERKNESK